jgi:hypothetical protein
MRPTIDEQLAGAARLLRLAESDPETTVAVAELVRNARRLVDRVGTSWRECEAFLREDNARTAALLDQDDVPTTGVEPTAERNEELRAELTRLIQTLPAGPRRTAIGAHLRARVDADPT